MNRRKKLKSNNGNYSKGPRWRSLYSDWLRAAQPSGWNPSLDRVRNFHFSYLSRLTGSGAHLAFYRMDTRGYFLGVKRPVCEADYSTPTSAEIKKKHESLHPHAKCFLRAVFN
jgi:hypothetical protein